MTSAVIITADKEIIELNKEIGLFNIIGIIDPRKDAGVFGITVLGGDNDWPEILSKYPGLKVILSVDPADLKEKLANYYGIDNLVTLISRDAYISPTAILDKGCLVQRGVKIMADAKIGKACKINVNATVHHDSQVGDYCTLAPGSLLLGAVKVENNVFVGAGAIILPKVRIGRNSIIGAGAVVTSHVKSGSTVVGVPGRVIKSKGE